MMEDRDIYSLQERCPSDEGQGHTLLAGEIS